MLRVLSSSAALATWHCTGDCVAAACRGVARAVTLSTLTIAAHQYQRIPAAMSRSPDREKGEVGSMLLRHCSAFISLHLLAIINLHKEDCTRNKEISFIQEKIWIFGCAILYIYMFP